MQAQEPVGKGDISSFNYLLYFTGLEKFQALSYDFY